MKNFNEIRDKRNFLNMNLDMTIANEVKEATDYITETIFANINAHTVFYSIPLDNLYRFNKSCYGCDFLQHVIASVISLGAKSATYDDYYFTVKF